MSNVTTMAFEEVCEELENILLLTEVKVKVFVKKEGLVKNIVAHSPICKSAYKIPVDCRLESF
jgi:hypothetical protein